MLCIDKGHTVHNSGPNRRFTMASYGQCLTSAMAEPVDEPWHALVIVASFLCIYGLTALVPLALALPVPISDMTYCKLQGGAVVTTARPHGISSQFRPKILLWGTGCSDIERQPREVKALNSLQLLLCDSQSLAGHKESSHGFCRLTRPGCLIWASVFEIPVLVVGLLYLLSLCSFTFSQLVAGPAILLSLITYGHEVRKAKNLLDQRIRWYQQRIKKNHSPAEFGASRALALHNMRDFFATFEMFILQRDV